jgi:hypothetical protein
VEDHYYPLTSVSVLMLGAMHVSGVSSAVTEKSGSEKHALTSSVSVVSCMHVLVSCRSSVIHIRWFLSCGTVFKIGVVCSSGVMHACVSKLS